MVERIRMRHGVGAVFVATVTVTIAAAAIVFAIADGTKSAADEGTVAVMAEASLSASAATYNGVVQAQVIARAKELSVATADDLERNLRQIDRTSSELVQRTDRLLTEIDDDRVAADLRIDLDEFVTSVNRLADQIAAVIGTR